MKAVPEAAGAVAAVLDVLGVRPDKVVVLKDVPLGNGNWLVEMPDRDRASAVQNRHPATMTRRYGRPARRTTLTWPRSVPWLYRVPMRGLGVGSAARGCPDVPAGLGLGDVPAGRLLYPVALPASRPGVAATGPAAFVVRLAMLEVGLTGVP